MAYKTRADDRVDERLLAVCVQYPSCGRISFPVSFTVVLVFLSPCPNFDGRASSWAYAVIAGVVDTIVLWLY